MSVPAAAGQPLPTAAAAATASVAAPMQPEIRQQVRHREVALTRLQQEVARQESDSERASRRLQEQDRQIAELRRELSRLAANPATGQPR